MILAFDTCLGSCSVAVGDVETLHASRCREMQRGHAEALIPMIAETLADAGLAPERIARIAVACGPGSFTGSRVGVAAARGLALALGTPAAGFTSLEILAAAASRIHPGKRVLAAIAARDDHLYHQPFDALGRPESPPALSGLSDARKLYEGRQGLSVGNGAKVLADMLEGLAPIAETGEPPAVTLLRLAARSDRARWAGRPSPLYLRPPDARLPAGRHGAPGAA